MHITKLNPRRWLVTDADGNEVATTKTRRDAEAVVREAKQPKEQPVKKTAGTRAIPTEAANAIRQAFLDEVGMDKYRSQYNSGWDAATYGQGVKKAESGTAPVAWMDGWTDRVANPGKEGISKKWSALRSKKAPVKAVDAPAKGKATKSA